MDAPIDWNLHGRIMKRKEVKQNFTVSTFKSKMKGIYSSCISKETLDEAPFAYRDLHSAITRLITPCAAYNALVWSFKIELRNFWFFPVKFPISRLNIPWSLNAVDLLSADAKSVVHSTVNSHISFFYDFSPLFAADFVCDFIHDIALPEKP